VPRIARHAFQRNISSRCTRPYRLEITALVKNKGGNGIYPKRVDAVCSPEFRTAIKILSSGELDLAYSAFSYELRLLTNAEFWMDTPCNAPYVTAV
jgi:hypothetical protein